MPVATTIARIDADNRRNFCSSISLNVFVAVNFFIKNFLREKRIPFNISGTYETSRNISLHNEAIHE